MTTALAENFFSILKAECIYRTKINCLAEARALIDDYIFFYNHQRIQSKTKLTPLWNCAASLLLENLIVLY
ncbi:MAG: IS3 family transposase [Oscillospiraceae bacterium]